MRDADSGRVSDASHPTAQGNGRSFRRFLWRIDLNHESHCFILNHSIFTCVRVVSMRLDHRMLRLKRITLGVTWPPCLFSAPRGRAHRSSVTWWSLRATALHFSHVSPLYNTPDSNPQSITADIKDWNKGDTHVQSGSPRTGLNH